MCIVSEERRLP